MPIHDHLSLTRRLSRAGVDFFDPNVPEQYPPDLGLEPRHLDIDLQVDITKATAGGTVTTTVQARRDGAGELVLDAVDFQDLAVEDAEGHELTWQYDGNKLSVHWLEPLQAGDERRLAVSYRVVAPVDGIYFSKPDEAYPDRPWYAATDHETERARHWLPCIDLPNVRTTLDFHLRAESLYTILANGTLLEEVEHDDGTKTAHWRLEQLCPSYLSCFAIGDFVRVDDGAFENGGDPIELAYFCSREHDGDMLMRSFGRTRPMMAWMTAKLDMAFPYPKYYQFALPQMFGAMENISLVSWTDQLLLDEELATEAGWLFDQINLHEMAHSYFGDAVVIRDFAHAWLKESWATYMEQCWAEDEHNLDEALYTYYDHAKAYFDEADERYQRPIVTRRFKSSWQMYDRHLYPGGACRLHTLRNELGDDLFWKAVRDYLKRFAGRVVETDDFRMVMEEHSGHSLGKFFDQWFHSPGYPDIKVSFKYDDKSKQGTFEIEQKQADLEKGVPAFTLNTDLSWTIDGETTSRAIKLEQAKHFFTVAMTSKPEMVRFDPFTKALHKLTFNPGDPLLRGQLSEAPDMIGRILAARELVKSGKRPNIEAVVAAYAKEPFWGVRKEMAAALAEANSEAAVAGLAQIVLDEEDPMVMQGVFQAAAKVRDVRIRDGLAQRLAGQLPPMARHWAYQAMGTQRQKADWDLLLAGSRQTGHNGFAQSGAFRGLAASRHDEAVDLLLEQLDYGIHSNRVRPNIAAALADIGAGLEKAPKERVLERLLDLLRDPWMKVQWSTVFALASLKAPEAIPALEAFARTQSRQIGVMVEKQADRLRAQDKVDGSAVKKQVEELRERMRLLEDQLGKMAAKMEEESG